MNDRRLALAETAVWVGIGTNLVLAIAKAAAGWSADSKALLADATNSGSFAAVSIAMLIGLQAAKKPSGRMHSHGRGKAESVPAVVASVILMLAGVEIGISSIESMVAGVDEAPAWYALAAIGASIALKEALFQYNYRLGAKLSNQALKAAAWNHRTDLLASLTALVGIGGAMLGGRYDVPLLLYLDPAAGVLISALVLQTAYRLVMDTAQRTSDHALQEAEAQELAQKVQSVKGVIAINDLRAREQGHYVVVDVKISVNPRLTVMEGHDIGKAVKHELMKSFSHVSDVFIHVDPYDAGYPYKSNHHPEVDDFPNMVH